MLNDDTWQYFVFRPKGENEIAGVIGLTYIHPAYRTAEFAICVDEDYRNNGYGSDALRTVIKYASMWFGLPLSSYIILCIS